MSKGKKFLRNAAAVTLPLAAMSVDAEAQTKPNLDRTSAKINTQALKLNNADLNVIRTDLSRLRGKQLFDAKANKAKAIEKQIAQIGGNYQIQWVKGGKIDPGKRRIIQING